MRSGLDERGCEGRYEKPLTEIKVRRVVVGKNAPRFAPSAHTRKAISDPKRTIIVFSLNIMKNSVIFTSFFFFVML